MQVNVRNRRWTSRYLTRFLKENKLFCGHLFQISVKQLYRSSCLHSASTVSKHFFIPTDAHNYKITGMLKTIKIPTIAAACFGSCRNHHQGAISCLAKTTVMILLCSSLMTWSMLWRHTSLLCKCAVRSRGRYSWWWFLREPKHVGAIVGILIVFNVPMSL